MTVITPLMQQYFAIKNNYPEALVFFQVGDFYELFFDDAKKASSILSITLTKRGYHNGEDIPLCGVPVHTIENHCIKLVKSGNIIVICNQTEKAEVGRLVTRGIANIISPATYIQENSNIDSTISAYILFISKHNNQIKVFFLEFIKQEVYYYNFFMNKNGLDCFLSELEKYSPKEIIIDGSFEKEFIQFINNKNIIYRLISYNFANEQIVSEFIGKNNIDKSKEPELKGIFNILFTYLNNYQPHILNLKFNFKETSSFDYLFLDSATQKHLELCINNHNNTSDGTLFSTLNHASTAMGSRLLKKIILRPSVCIETIKLRQNIIEKFIINIHLANKISDLLKNIGDLERISYRINMKKAMYKDYQKILSISSFIDEVIQIINNNFYENKESLINSISSISESLQNILKKYISNENIISNDIKINIDSDETLKNIQEKILFNTKQIVEYEQEEKLRTNISDLCIKETPLYSYVFELSKAKYKELPTDYIRIQTLSNKERYSTKRLKELEMYLINSKEEFSEREKYLFSIVEDSIYNNVNELIEISKALSNLDFLISLSKAAYINNWTKPNINNSLSKLEIIEGKHPILMNLLKDQYISNDLKLDNENKSWIITGPNMGGKSTFMKQNALIVLLAHIGSYVPARIANIPIMDAIFTRVGASDNMLQAKSTFFVEMEESATITRMATSKSFIILDEIGRGTSTYDGMSIAAAIIDYINIYKNSYVLFATHYHELNKLIESKIAWYYAETKMYNNELLLLYKIRQGISSDSMGIYLASKIGLDEKIISMAIKYKNILEK